LGWNEKNEKKWGQVRSWLLREKDQLKSMTLNAEEFIRRFLLHVLPDGFMPACACRTQTGASVTSTS